MRSLDLTRALARPALAALAALAAFGLSQGCAKKPRSSEHGSSRAAAALADLPEPAGILADFRLAHPDATFRSLRELGRPLSALLPAGFPMLAASLLGLPPLTADSFDPELPVVGLLIQNGASPPSWLLALHVVSGPELVAKLCTGNQAPFRALASAPAGLSLIQPSAPSAKAAPALAVFDNYLLIAESAESLLSAGPYAARMLPKRPAARAAIALRFSHPALESKLVPALRGLWAAYRTRLAHMDQTDRSAHGGRSPDFADPAQVILGADALVESLLSLVDGAAALELDLEPFANRLDATVLLEPELGSEVQTKLAALAEADARTLLTLPAETQFALGLSRTNDEREAAGKTAGDDWVRLLGARLSERDAQQLRGVLADWELGRGTQTSYGFLGGSEPGAFLVAKVADAARLKRAGPGFFGLLALPGVRAPLAEFLGQPRVSEAPRAKRRLGQRDAQAFDVRGTRRQARDSAVVLRLDGGRAASPGRGRDECRCPVEDRAAERAGSARYLGEQGGHRRFGAAHRRTVGAVRIPRRPRAFRGQWGASGVARAAVPGARQA